MQSQILRCLLYTCLGYFSGSIMYSYWIPRLVKKVDVRESASDRNPGAANATIACGLPIGILCGFLDVVKGTVPVALAINLSSVSGWLLVPVAVSPVIGHAWPLALRGKGGKAIAVSFGALAGLLPHYFLAPILAVVVLICLPFLKEHRRVMFFSGFGFVVVTFVLYQSWNMRVIAMIVGIVLMIKHRPAEIRILRRKKNEM